MAGASRSTDVSRETFEALEVYTNLLIKWTKKINLIAMDSVDSVWERHINDSVQLFRFIPTNLNSFLDLGSGGGLPGIVLAILLRERQPGTIVTMIESDARKSAFLRTAVRECGLTATVVNARIGDVDPVQAGCITARALAPLPDLLGHVTRHLGVKGVAVLPKGRNFAAEIEIAAKNWHFDVETHQSLTDPQARILELRNISHVKD